MADSKITALTAISTVDPTADPLVIVDVSDTSMAASGTTKKSTINQLLGSGGTATLASATISGALDAARLNVTGATIPANGVYLGSANNLSFSAASTLGMTLNSTGLGVGVASPVTRLQANKAGQTPGGVSGPNGALVISDTSNTSVVLELGTDSAAIPYIQSRHISSYGFYDLVLQPTSGNVGIGVQPNSLWAIGKVLQVGSTSGSFLYGAGGQLITGVNAYYDTAWKYAANGRANYYQQSSGVHSWFYDSGTQVAGTAANFVQAMTLDASGNLLVGTTSATVNNNGYRVVNDGNTNSARLELGSASSTNSNIGLSMYSTGVPAYRFYVGWGGTVFATNTTISAISDARLKENVQDIDVGLGAILALKPRKFDWKAGKGKDIKGDRGFIAQEFEQVFPQLVDEWKDAAPEGEAPYKSVRQDLIPVLVKAIQELTARVQTLETR